MKKICRNCGQLKEHEAFGLCRYCYVKQWNKNNPEKIKKYTKKWREENPKIRRQWRENNLGYQNKWRENNKEKTKQYSKKYKKRVSINGKKWREENSERQAENIKRWKEKNPEKARIIRKQSSLKRRIPGIIKKNIVNKLVNENIFKYGIITCEKCRKPCEGNYHIDHIKPVSKGGMNNYDNLQILCANCNHTKFTKIVDYRKKQINNQLSLGGSNGSTAD